MSAVLKSSSLALAVVGALAVGAPAAALADGVVPAIGNTVGNVVEGTGEALFGTSDDTVVVEDRTTDVVVEDRTPDIVVEDRTPDVVVAEPAPVIVEERAPLIVEDEPDVSVEVN